MRGVQCDVTCDWGIDVMAFCDTLTNINISINISINFDREAENAFDEMQIELFAARGQTDSTPGALLFFATLNDSKTVSSLQQLMLQLNNLRGAYFLK